MKVLFFLWLDLDEFACIMCCHHKEEDTWLLVISNNIEFSKCDRFSTHYMKRKLHHNVCVLLLPSQYIHYNTNLMINTESTIMHKFKMNEALTSTLHCYSQWHKSKIVHQNTRLIM